MIEIGFRVAYTEPWYERLEQEQNQLARPERLVDGASFTVREDLEDAHKPDEVFRILFLGDSFTYGSGVRDPEDVFPALVSNALREDVAARSGRTIEGWNGGIPGSLPHNWIELFDAAQPVFQPDLVVTVFFLRDGTHGIGGSRARITAIGAKMAELSRTSWLYRNYSTYRYFREKAAQRDYSDFYMTAMRTAYLGPQYKTEQWRRAQQNILDLRRMTLEGGGEFVLVIFPVLFALDPDYPLTGVLDEIERFAAENDIRTMSLFPSFRGRHAPDLWISELDQHPNEEGHRIAADAISDYLLPIVSP